MRHPTELGLRRLLLTVSTFVFLASLLAIYALRFLPADPLHLRKSLSVYLIFFLVVSLIGFAGAVKRNATLITLFATHLILDGVLFFIPRLLLIRFSFSLPALICSNSEYPEDSVADLGHPVSANRNATSSWENSIKQLSSPAWSEGSCRVWMWGFEIGFVSLLLVLMGVQALLGVKLFGYAAWLGRKKKIERMERELC